MPLLGTRGAASARAFGLSAGNVLVPLNWSLQASLGGYGSGTGGPNIFWLNNRFIAVLGAPIGGGSQGYFAYSTNGVNWTLVPTGNSKNVKRAAYGNGYWAVVQGQSTSGNVVHSTNGVSWTSTGGEGYVWETITYNSGDGYFYLNCIDASSSTENGRCYRTTDPSNPLQQSRGRVVASNNFRIWHSATNGVSGHVLVAGYDQNSGNGAIWRSIDGGNSWTQTLSVPPVPGSNTDIYSIQWTGTQYIATGPDASSVVTGNTWTSPDGATWTKVGTGEGYCLVYNGTRYVLSSNALSMSGSSPGGPFAYDTGSNLGYSTAYSPTLNLWASIFYAYRSSTWFADIYTAPGP